MGFLGAGPRFPRLPDSLSRHCGAPRRKPANTSSRLPSRRASCSNPLAPAKDLVTAPGKTIGDTFKGVGNLFGSVDASMAATDPNKEGVLASVNGGATARRKLAYDFGVDPNTSFPPLHDELTRPAPPHTTRQA